MEIVNERIRELIRESHLDVYGLGKDRYKWESTVDKFAEMIVAECLLFTNPSPHEGTEFGTALAWADKNIREHFGVE
jgi:hypothetical protein